MRGHLSDAKRVQLRALAIDGPAVGELVTLREGMTAALDDLDMLEATVKEQIHDLDLARKVIEAARWACLAAIESPADEGHDMAVIRPLAAEELVKAMEVWDTRHLTCKFCGRTSACHTYGGQPHGFVSEGPADSSPEQPRPRATTTPFPIPLPVLSLGPQETQSVEVLVQCAFDGHTLAVRAKDKATGQWMDGDVLDGVTLTLTCGRVIREAARDRPASLFKQNHASPEMFSRVHPFGPGGVSPIDARIRVTYRNATSRHFEIATVVVGSAVRS